MGLLRWVAIVVPALFIVAVDILRQTIFFHQAYVFPGYAGLVFTYAITLVAIVAFAYAIFGVIGRLQWSIVERNRQSRTNTTRSARPLPSTRMPSLPTSHITQPDGDGFRDPDARLPQHNEEQTVSVAFCCAYEGVNLVGRRVVGERPAKIAGHIGAY